MCEEVTGEGVKGEGVKGEESVPPATPKPTVAPVAAPAQGVHRPAGWGEPTSGNNNSGPGFGM